MSLKCGKQCDCTLRVRRMSSLAMRRKPVDRSSRSNSKGGAVICHRIRSDAAPKLLLIQSRGRLWGYPKGSKEDAETITECAVRELREETGLVRNEKNAAFSVDIRHKSTFSKYLVFDEQTDALPELTLEDEHDCTGGGWITLSCMRDLVASRCIKLTSDCSSVLDIPDIRTLFGEPQVQRTFSPNRTIRVDRLKCTNNTTIKTIQNDNTADERRSIGMRCAPTNVP